MFELHFEAPISSSSWAARSNGWSNGANQISPLRHPALEELALSTEDRLLVVVRERWSGQPAACQEHRSGAIARVSRAELEDALAQALAWPLQFTALLVLPSSVVIHCGCWGTAPLFLLADENSLQGHWDPAAHYGRLRARSLDPVLVSHFLCRFETPYSRRTLLPDVQMLTERACARWDGRQEAPPSGRLAIEYPAPVEPGRPRRLKPDADVIGTCREILTSSMRRWTLAETERGVAAALSGGLDSGLVAATASSLWGRPGGGLRTYGLCLPDRGGVEQAERRRALIARYDFDDTALDIAGFLPLSPGSSRTQGRPFVPWEECYYEAFDELLGLAGGYGTRLLFTGFGGDELCSLWWEDFTPAERNAATASYEASRSGATHPLFLSRFTRELYADSLETVDRAPRSAVASSAVETAALGASLYIRHGVWPVHPLCTPELAWFCRSLPREWRSGRRIQRELLTHVGCPPIVAYPVSIDDFSSVMVKSLQESARPLLLELFRESRLADLGYLERDALLSAYADFCAHGGEEADVPFCAVAFLELTLRSLDAQSESPAP